jgi:hypothetical protein
MDTKELEQKLRDHDWWHQYSDDYSVVRRGERQWSELVALINTFPIETVRPLWIKHSPSDFHKTLGCLFSKK